MMRRVGLGAKVTIAALLLLVACGDDDDPTTTTTDEEPGDGTLVEGDGYRGVLLDAGLDHLQQADGSLLEDEEVGSFVPTEADVERFEAQLPDVLVPAGNPSGEEVTADDLAGYVRQYTGVAGTAPGSDDRHLVVAAICASAADDGLDWQYGWVEVNDGGTCFWDATMDLGTGEMLRFSFHGSA
jgi:hypothetical protein